MIFSYLFISSYLTLPFCGSDPCVPCPQDGDCSSGALKCQKPFKAFRYDCAEKDSPGHLSQAYLLEAEKFMLIELFLTGNSTKTELDLFLDTEAENLIFDYFIELVKSNSSKVLKLGKNESDRYLEVSLQFAWLVGCLLFIDSYWPLWSAAAGFVCLAGVTRHLYNFISKIKVE